MAVIDRISAHSTRYAHHKESLPNVIHLRGIQDFSAISVVLQMCREDTCL